MSPATLPNEEALRKLLVHYHHLSNGFVKKFFNAIGGIGLYFATPTLFSLAVNRKKAVHSILDLNHASMSSVYPTYILLYDRNHKAKKYLRLDFRHNNIKEHNKDKTYI